MKTSTKNQRIKDFYKAKGLTQKEFAEIIGASQQYISAVVNGRREVGSNIIYKIKDKFYDFNEYWFLTGQGLMFVEEEKIPLVSEIDDNLGLNAEINQKRKAEFEVILDEMSADEIITYIYKYEKEKFAENETYKKFIKVQRQRGVIEHLEKELRGE